MLKDLVCGYGLETKLANLTDIDTGAQWVKRRDARS